MVCSEYAMPIIVLNMGGEMAYILTQRLQAQSVQDDKAKKVLQDVMKAMYSSVFIEELFKPQVMYCTVATKQIFEKLAHSSIMRLNKSSMDKLYDLMTMGFKRQIMASTSPQNYVIVTLNHLESLKELMRDTPVCDLIQVAIDKTIAMYTKLTVGQLLALKYSLFRFLQEKKVKVSLFLQQSLQTVDGLIVLSNAGKLPCGTEKVGSIRYYEGGVLLSTKSFQAAESVADSQEVNESADAHSALGLNIYSKDSQAAAPSRSSVATHSEAIASFSNIYRDVAKDVSGNGAFHSTSAEAKSASRLAAGATMSMHYQSQSSGRSTAKAELTLLADLLGVQSKPAAADESKPLRINLFPDTYSGDGKAGVGEDFKDLSGGSWGMIHIDIDGAADAKSIDRYLIDLDLKDDRTAEAKSHVDEEDDLLALMDSAK